MNSTQQIKALFSATATYYQQAIGDEVLSMYARDLGDQPLERITAAFDVYRKNPRNRRCPFPADILDLLDPKLTSKDEARDMAELLYSQVSRIGYANSERAATELHPVALEVARRSGGWSAFCQTLPDRHSDSNNFAQIRDQIEVLLKKYKADPDNFAKLQISDGIGLTKLNLNMKNIPKLDDDSSDE